MKKLGQLLRTTIMGGVLFIIPLRSFLSFSAKSSKSSGGYSPRCQESQFNPLSGSKPPRS